MAKVNAKPPTDTIRVRDLALLAGKPHKESLLEWAADASEISVFVSFLFPEGVQLVRELLKRATVDVTVSTYLRATRKAALRELLTLLTSSTPNPLRVRVATGDKDGFHGKVYRFTYGDGTARIVVGSANLSKGGLEGRGEVSMTVAGPATTVPVLDDAELPALIDKTWSTRDDPTRLARVIESYKESKLGGQFGEGLYSDVASFVGVGDTSEDEAEFIDFVDAAAPLDLRGTLEGDRTGHDEQLIFNPASKERAKWAELATRLSIGDVVFLGWEKETLRGYRLLARYIGHAPSLDPAQIVLFLRSIRGSKHRGKAVKWRNRMIPREQLPPKVARALAADTTPPKAAQ